MVPFEWFNKNKTDESHLLCGSFLKIGIEKRVIPLVLLGCVNIERKKQQKFRRVTLTTFYFK